MERCPVPLGVIEQNPFVLNGLVDLLGRDSRFEVVVAVGEGRAALARRDLSSCSVLVCGWAMPDLGGAEVIRELQIVPRAPRVIVYTGSPDPTVPREVMFSGGAGFCPKSAPLEVLVNTILVVAAGQMVFPFTDLRDVLTDPFAELTRREFQLLEKLSAGKTNRELALELGVSVNTVKYHLRNLFDKLSIRNRSEAAARFLTYRGS